MDWQKIRELCPNRWVLIEALETYTQNGMRCVPVVVLIDVLDQDGAAGWHEYTRWHTQYPQREFYSLHTVNKQIEIEVVHAKTRTRVGDS
jgi:hypothetical protein